MVIRGFLETPFDTVKSLGRAYNRPPKPVGVFVLCYNVNLNNDLSTLRFNAENKERRHQCAWAPFGIGNRNCVGMRLALLEMKVTLVAALRNFVFEPCEETPVS